MGYFWSMSESHRQGRTEINPLVSNTSPYQYPSPRTPDHPLTPAFSKELMILLWWNVKKYLQLDSPSVVIKGFHIFSIRFEGTAAMPASSFTALHCVFGHLPSPSLTVSTPVFDVSFISCCCRDFYFYPNNSNQRVSNRYLRDVWEGCLWSQPGVPGHGEAVSHQLLHLLLLRWVKQQLQELPQFTCRMDVFPPLNNSGERNGCAVWCLVIFQCAFSTAEARSSSGVEMYGSRCN